VSPIRRVLAQIDPCGSIRGSTTAYSEFMYAHSGKDILTSTNVRFITRSRSKAAIKKRVLDDSNDSLSEESPRSRKKVCFEPRCAFMRLTVA
jgi:hypothetical protein